MTTRNLDGASIVLAGASGGLGSAIGAELSKSGARLVLFGRDDARLTATNLDGERVTGNLGDPEACQAAVKTAIDSYGRVDGIVNAAGTVAFGEVSSLSDDVIDIRPPHTETGLADRPLAGTAPSLPEGLDPDVVARTIVEAIASGARELPSNAF